MKMHKSITELQRRLDAISSEKTKIWWEKYLRGAAAFRGVGIPQIRDILTAWRHDTGVAKLPVDEQLEIALALFEVPITEDKLAGILLLQDYLRKRFDWRDLLPRFASLYERNLIYDWNTCDWFCVSVLGPTLAENGMTFARALSKWRNATHLWQARSAAVPFIKVAESSIYYPTIKTVCTTLVARPERFAKTAVGWLLRDVSRHDPDMVLSFLKSNVERLSLESARNAMKYMDGKTSRPLLEIIKRAEQGVGEVRSARGGPRAPHR
jgi:3-methyladenine DNA glycosylase AlkD